MESFRQRAVLHLNELRYIAVVGRIGKSVTFVKVMAARPLVLPEPFDGKKSWDDWKLHFEDVAAVNEWTAPQKLKWLRVRLTGRAQNYYLTSAYKTETHSHTHAHTYTAANHSGI